MTSEQVKAMTVFQFFHAWAKVNGGLRNDLEAQWKQEQVVRFLEEMEKQNGKS